MSNVCCSDYDVVQKTKHSLVPLSSGEEQCAPHHSWGPGVRSHYLIHYIISGKGVFYCGPNKFHLKKGQIFVVFPDTIVKYEADEIDPWHYVWINFYGEESKSILQAAGLSLQNPVKNVQGGNDLADMLRQMPSERTADMSENLKFFAKLYEFMSLLTREGCHAESKESDYLEEAVRYIKAHHHEQITVESIARYVGISRKYLYAIFKNALGISPKDYVIDYRMEKAKEFLLNESLPVGSIAYSVGYDDALNFSKMFKSKTGMSPSEYRNMLKK